VGEPRHDLWEVRVRPVAVRPLTGLWRDCNWACDLYDGRGGWQSSGYAATKAEAQRKARNLRRRLKR